MSQLVTSLSDSFLNKTSSELNKVKNKGRTPSGNILSNNFGDIRTIFSPEGCKTCDNSAIATSQPEKSELNNSLRLSDSAIKASAIAKAQRIKRKRAESASRKNITSPTSSDCEGEKDFDFFTPPATPVRKKVAVGKKATSKPITEYLSASNTSSKVVPLETSMKEIYTSQEIMQQQVEMQRESQPEHVFFRVITRNFFHSRIFCVLTKNVYIYEGEN